MPIRPPPRANRDRAASGNLDEKYFMPKANGLKLGGEHVIGSVGGGGSIGSNN